MKKVGIIMGSDSDLPVVEKAAETLKSLESPYEMHVYSAHRTPVEARDLSLSAREQGFGEIIAAAGMAAHLPGMFAALFPLPVIGIPMYTKALGGKDSLYSIVQMPSGIPTATVAIDGGANAGLLAVKMLAISDEKLLKALKEYSAELKEGVAKKDERLQETGYKAYLEEQNRK